MVGGGLDVEFVADRLGFGRRERLVERGRVAGKEVVEHQGATFVIRKVDVGQLTHRLGEVDWVRLTYIGFHRKGNSLTRHTVIGTTLSRAALMKSPSLVMKKSDSTMSASQHCRASLCIARGSVGK